MNTQKNNSLGPFIVLTFIYFIVGFLTTVNGQFQGPLKIAFLSHTDELRNTLTTFISFFFFLGYLLNSSLGGKWINVHGYKKTLLRALSIMVIGLLMYSLSSWLVVHYGDARILIFKDQVPYGYFIFLLGSYLMGTSAALLQVVINPYIAAYELPNTQPVQRINIVCAINSFGTTIAPFFVTGIIFAGVTLESVTADQLMFPFLMITLCIIITTLITSRLNLPDIQGTRVDNNNKAQTQYLVLSTFKFRSHRPIFLCRGRSINWSKYQFACNGTNRKWAQIFLLWKKSYSSLGVRSRYPRITRHSLLGRFDGRKAYI